MSVQFKFFNENGFFSPLLSVSLLDFFLLIFWQKYGLRFICYSALEMSLCILIYVEKES